MDLVKHFSLSFVNYKEIIRCFLTAYLERLAKKS